MASNIDAPTAVAITGVGLWIGMRGPQASIDGRDVTFYNPEEGMSSGKNPTENPKGFQPECNWSEVM